MGLKLNGSTSGSIEIDVPAVAGTDTAITIPATTGGEFIVSDSSGNIDLGALDISGSASADSVVIDSSDRLLVGTSSTSANATALFAGNPSGNYTALYLAATTTSFGTNDVFANINFTDSGHTVAASIGCGRDSGTWTSGSSQPTKLVFSTTANGASSTTERARINAEGVAIFTTDGSYTSVDTNSHAVRTAIAGTWLIDTFHAAGSGANGIHVEYGTTPNGNNNHFFYADDATAKRFAVRSNGGIENFQSNNVNLSDEREKKNIEALDSTWGCLKNWDLKKFHYNEDADTDDKRYGVIAQQVAPHCPEVITDWVKQRAKDAVLDDDGNVVTPAQEEIVRMGVKEQQMMWMAIKALQEAQTRIETLETANASQAATIAAFEARLTALEGGAA